MVWLAPAPELAKAFLQPVNESTGVAPGAPAGCSWIMLKTRTTGP